MLRRCRPQVEGMGATNLLDSLRLLQQREWDRVTPPVAQADAMRLGSWLHDIDHMAEPAEGNVRYW